MTELERKAMLGDKQAQEECTKKDIVLPCPLCGKKPGPVRHAVSKNLNLKAWAVCCGGENCRSYVMGDTPKETVKNWNTRPAPPIGKCEDCKYWRNGDCFRLELSRPNDYCSYFEPKE